MLFSVPKYLRRQWTSRPLAVFSVCFLLGILWGMRSRLPFLPVVFLASAFFVAYIILKKRRGVQSLALLTLVAVLAGNLHMLAALKNNPPVPELFSVNYKGTVVSEPYFNAEGDRIICVLRLKELNGAPTHCDVRLYLRSDEIELAGIEYGQTLDCFGHVWPQDSATNPHQYDAMNGLRADNLSGLAAAKLEDVLIHPASPSLGSLRVHIRRIITEQIERLFPENAQLVCAFVLGERNGLDEETRDTFSRTGITHLICISGLHISTLAMAVSKLLSLKFSRKASLIGTLLAVLLYGFLIGFPASLIRATVMFAVYSLVPIVGLPSDPITRLSAALLGMLVFNPFAIYDGGFVLSFGASTGILLLTEPLESLLGVHRLKRMKPHPKRIIRLGQRLLRYFPMLLCTTLAAQLATLPAVIAYFGSQPLISIPVNLVAIPLAMFAYPLSLIALISSAILPPLGKIFAAMSDGMFSALVDLVRFFASIPAGSLRSPSYPCWLLFAHCIVVLLSSGLNRIALPIRRFIPALLVAFVGLSMLNAWINAQGFCVTFLDAGQADAAVIKAEGHVYLCDVGDSYSPAADYASGSCLGVDAVFLSHPHYDHAAGLSKLLTRLPPRIIYVPEGWFEVEATESVAVGIKTAQEMNIPIIELSPGAELHPSDNVTIRVHASGKPDNSINDMSMLLEFEYRDRSVFFTGDLTAEGEPDAFPDIDVLKVPHHGSSKATSEQLLNMTTPEVAIISVGDNNYGHPSSETMDRLTSIGSSVYRTDQCGAVSVRIHEDGEIQTQTFLPQEEFS